MDLGLWITAALTQAAVAFIGIVALNADFAKDHYRSIVLAFLALTIVGMSASGWSYARSSKSSELVNHLTQQILFEVRGSPDAFLEIYPIFEGPGSYENGVATFNYSNESGYSMIDTSVGIVGTCSVEAPDYGRRIGDVYAGRGGRLPLLTAKLSKEKDNRIDFAIRSRSVTTWEYLYITWNGKGWVSDCSIRKRVDAEGNEEYVKRLRPGFPFKEKSSSLHEKYLQDSDAENSG